MVATICTTCLLALNRICILATPCCLFHLIFRINSDYCWTSLTRRDLNWRRFVKIQVFWDVCKVTSVSLERSVFETSVYTGLFEMIVGVLTTATSFSRCNPMWFLSMGLRQGSDLCSSSSRDYPGTEGTNQNRHWNHHRGHATDSLERTWLSCWCL